MGYDSSFLFGAIVEALSGLVERFRINGNTTYRVIVLEIKKTAGLVAISYQLIRKPAALSIVLFLFVNVNDLQ